MIAEGEDSCFEIKEEMEATSSHPRGRPLLDARSWLRMNVRFSNPIRVVETIVEQN